MNNKILFLTEVPTAHLDELHPLIDGHFCIASECLKDPAYYAWYKNKPKDCYVMLDNGMFEEGKPLDPLQLLELAFEIQPDVVFAPDQVGMMDLTLSLSYRFMELAYKRNYKGEVGLIPQGKDADEVATCYNRMCNGIGDAHTTFGISFLNDRPAVVDAIMANGGWSSYDNHHFLGMYNLNEISSWPANVVSCDTIKPFKAAYFGFELEHCPRGLGKWDTKLKITNQEKLLYRNYAKMHQALTRRNQ